MIWYFFKYYIDKNTFLENVSWYCNMLCKLFFEKSYGNNNTFITIYQRVDNKSVIAYHINIWFDLQIVNPTLLLERCWGHYKASFIIAAFVPQFHPYLSCVKPMKTVRGTTITAGTHIRRQARIIIRHIV